ncbi:MAG TPA: hypothetical protein VHA13_02620, partial [Gammaproteobacteria bacterium]|nr:hypothetical protein [Gammaproteobacteria bacterium]
MNSSRANEESSLNESVGNSASASQTEQATTPRNFQESERLAFIVNIPIAIQKDQNNQADAAGTIQKMMDIRSAYLDGYDPNTCPPFKMVFGVNCHESEVQNLVLLHEQWDKFKKENNYSDTNNPVSVVTRVWDGKKFPYGSIRNEIMHSFDTQKAVKEFTKDNYYPYIAIGDADTGSRKVEVGEKQIHVFKAIEEKLNGKLNTPSPSDDSSREQKSNEASPNQMSISARFSPKEEFALSPESNTPNHFYVRPYLIAGGYKPIDAGELPEAKETVIQQDMDVRAQLANRVNPMGPYFPEPNLFIDGHISAKVNFGQGGAEFLKLREEVAGYIKQDILNGKPGNATHEEWQENAAVYLQNNRHPDRGKLVSTFFDLAIETETDRLFRKIGEQADNINPNVVAQHHAHPTMAKAAYLLDRYDAKRNGKSIFVDVRDFLAKNSENLPKVIEFYHELIYRQKTANPEYKQDILDQSYLEYRTKDADILKLADSLIKEAAKINLPNKQGQPNRSVHQFANLDCTTLDIFNTAMAVVFKKDINNLLHEYWKGELQKLMLNTVNSESTHDDSASINWEWNTITDLGGERTINESVEFHSNKIINASARQIDNINELQDGQN